MSSVVARLNRDALELLRGVLLAEPPSDIRYDDFHLHPEMRLPEQVSAVEAAVLIPLIARDDGAVGPCCCLPAAPKPCRVIPGR